MLAVTKNYFFANTKQVADYVNCAQCLLAYKFVHYMGQFYHAFDFFHRRMPGPRPVVLSGPSGAGKSTLLKRLMEEYEGVFGFSVSRKQQ